MKVGRQQRRQRKCTEHFITFTFVVINRNGLATAFVFVIFIYILYSFNTKYILFLLFEVSNSLLSFRFHSYRISFLQAHYVHHRNTQENLHRTPELYIELHIHCLLVLCYFLAIESNYNICITSFNIRYSSIKVCFNSPFSLSCYTVYHAPIQNVVDPRIEIIPRERSRESRTLFSTKILGPLLKFICFVTCINFLV